MFFCFRWFKPQDYISNEQTKQIWKISDRRAEVALPWEFFGTVGKLVSAVSDNYSDQDKSVFLFFFSFLSQLQTR